MILEWSMKVLHCSNTCVAIELSAQNVCLCSYKSLQMLKTKIVA